jgi:hypothetical protein
MTNRLIVLMVLTTCTTALFAEEPKLTGKVRLFATSQPAYKRPNQHHAFTMRLSPDGKQVLYTRQVAGSEKSNNRSAQYELVMRELHGGKETVLPIERLDSGWRSVPTRFNIFDPAGKRVVLMNIKIETKQTDKHTSVNKRSIKWMVYDIAKSKATGKALESGSAGPVKFTADGQALLLTGASGRGKLVTTIISLKDAKAKPKPLTAPGWVQSVSPAGDVLVFFAPPARPAARPQPGQRRQRPAIRLLLWDIKADKQLAQLPTHRRNGNLDDCETQWTSDGRYLYYLDVAEAPVEGQPDRPKYSTVTRIWDRQAGKLSGKILDAVPVGPGPGRSLMMLAKRTQNGSGGFLLHNARTGKEYPLGDASKKLIHALGGKVLYAEKPDQSDSEGVFSADIVVPKVLD